MYAIRHKKTKKWVYGTDFRMRHPRMTARKISGKYYSHEQFTSEDKALLFGDYLTSQVDFEYRGCGKDYEIVEVVLMTKIELDALMKGERKKEDEEKEENDA